MADVKHTRRPGRPELIAALNHGARESSGLGVLFGETVARRMRLDQTALECLGIVAGGDRVTAGMLAAATGLTTGAVTGVIDRLEKAGLARRVRDREDRRKVYVHATPHALRQANAFYGPLGKAVDALAARYSDKELALLIDYFDRTRGVVLSEIERLNGAARARRQPAD